MPRNVIDLFCCFSGDADAELQNDEEKTTSSAGTANSTPARLQAVSLLANQISQEERCQVLSSYLGADSASLAVLADSGHHFVTVASSAAAGDRNQQPGRVIPVAGRSAIAATAAGEYSPAQVHSGSVPVRDETVPPAVHGPGKAFQRTQEPTTPSSYFSDALNAAFEQLLHEQVTIRSGDVAPRLQQQDGGRRFLLVPLWWAGELLGALTVVWGPAADAVATAAAATKEGLPTAAATAGRGKSSNGNTTPFVWRGAAGKGSRRVRDERAIGSSSSKGGSSSGGAGCGGATATVCISEPPQQQVPVLLPREVEEQEAAAAAHLMRLGLFGSSAAHVALLRRACGLAAAAAYPRASWVVIGGGGCGRSSSTCCVGELLQALSGGAEAILNDRHQLWHTPQHLSVLAAAVLHPPPSPSAGVAAPATATAAAAGSTGDGANSAQLAHLLPAHPRLRAIRTSHSRHDDDGSHDATAAATAQGPPQQPPPPGGWAGPAETATLAFFPLTASAAPQAPATPAPPNDYCYSPLPVSTSQPSTPLSAVANNGLLHQRSSFSLHLQRQMQQQLKPQHLRRSVQGVDPELTLLGQAAAAAAATDANATPPTVLATAAGGAVVGTSSETTATVLLPDCAGELMREEGHVPLDVMMAARRLVAAPLAVAASASPQAVATGACQTTNGGAVGSAAAVCAVPRQLSAAAAAGCSSSNSSGAAVQQQAQLPVLGLVLCSGGAIAEGFLAAVAEDAATIVQICNGALRDALRPPLPGAVAGPDATAGSPAAAANCWQQLLLHDGHCGCYCRAAEAASATASARAAVASDDPHHQLQSQQLQQGGVQDADAHEREREREQERVCTLLGTMMSGGLNPQLEDMVVDTPRVAAVRQQSYGHGQGHGHAQNGRMFTRRGSSTMTGHDVMLGSSAASVCPMAMAAAAAAATAGTAAGADSCDGAAVMRHATADGLMPGDEGGCSFSNRRQPLRMARPAAAGGGCGRSSSTVSAATAATAATAAADGRSMSAALRWRSPQTSHLGMILTTGGTNGCMSGAGGGAAGCGGGVGGLAASGTAIDSALFGDPLMTTVSITSGTNGLFRGLGAAGGGGGTGGGGSTTATGAHATAASLLAAATTPAPPISPMQVMIQTITTSIAQTLSATERTDSPERQLEDLSALTLLGEPLGWGGQGVVFRGTLHALEVAVKVCAYTDAYSTPLPSPPPSAFWLLPTAASAGVASATQSGAGLAAPVAAGEGMNGPALLSAAAVGTAAAAGAAAGFGGGASPPLLPPGAHNSFNTYSCTPIRHSSRAGGGWAAAAYACGGGDTAGRSGGSSSGGPMAAANVAAAATATEATAAAATATTPTSSTSNSRAGFRAAANTSRRGAASVAGEVDGVGTSGAATAGAGATAGAAAHHPAAVLVGGVGAAGNTTSGSSSRVRATRFASEPPTQLATATTLAAAPATAATAGGGAAAVPRGNWGAGAATPTAPSPFLRTRGVSVDSAAVAATATRAAAVGQASQQAAAAAVAASDTAATLITAGSTASAATVPLASPAGTPRGTAAAAAYLQSAPCSTGGGGGGGGGGSAAGSCVLQSGEWPRPGAGAGAGAAKHDLNKVSMLRNAAELAVCSALPGHPHLVQLFGYHTEVQLVISQPPLQPSPPHAPATANAAAATAEAAASSAAAAAAAVARGAAAVEHQRPLALVPSHLVPHLGLPVVQLQQLQQPAQLQLLQPAAAHAAALQPQQHHLALVMEYCDSGDLRTAAEAGWLLRAPEPWEEAAAAGCGGGGGGGMWGGRVLDMRAIYTTLLEVALALRHLHRHGLAHCDVKPSNILLRSSPRDPRGWTAKLSDFGCVRLLRPQPQPQPQSAPHTQHGMLPQASQHGGGAALGGGGSGGHSSSRSSGWLLAGGGCGVGNPSPPPPPPPAVPADDSHHQHRCWSPSVAAPVSPPPAGFRVLHLPVGSFTHSAPELFVRGAWLDASLDVYALGIVMWELASLAPVYPAGMSPPEVARLVLAGARPVFAPHVPAEYSALASACWAHDPARRPTAAALVQRLQQLLRAHEAAVAAAAAAAAATAAAAAATAAAATAASAAAVVRPWPYQARTQQWPHRATLTSIPMMMSAAATTTTTTAAATAATAAASAAAALGPADRSGDDDMGLLRPPPPEAAAAAAIAPPSASPTSLVTAAAAPALGTACTPAPLGVPAAAGTAAEAASYAVAQRAPHPSPPPPPPPPQQQQQPMPPLRMSLSPLLQEQQQQAREMKRQGNEFQQPRANPNAQYLTATLAPPPPPPQQPQPQQEQKQDIGMHLSAVISDVTVADPGGGCGGGYGSYFGCAEPFPLLHAAAADGVDFSPWGGGGAAAGVAIVPEDEPLFVLMRAAAGGGGGSGGSGGGGNASNRGVAAAAAATTFGAAGIAAGAGGGDRRAGGSRWLG